MGVGPKPANSEALTAIQQGVSAWNNWRKDKDVSSLNLSGADLHSRDLTGADLRGVDLSYANLRNAKLLGKDTLLWNANLSNADLYQTNFRGADLQDVNFSNADLYQADLRESNLQGADLSTAKGGLLSRQLAGSDLTGAKLPEPLAKLYDSLSSVKEISDSAQKLFLALLAGCLYSWLTIAQTTDVELITNRATTPLPIIQAAIPIVGFYVVAPLILLCLYFYFHFYLQKLWEELGSLPAIFTDGRELHKRTDPWLLNDLVRSHFVKLKGGRPFLSYFQAWISVMLSWWLVPITLFGFWLRLLRRHDLFWTMVHVLLLALAIFSAVRLYGIANQTLHGEDRASFRWKELLKHRRIFWQPAFLIGLGVLFTGLSIGVIFGEPGEIFFGNEPEATIDSPRTWIPWLLDRVGYHPFADLADAGVSEKPPNWTGKRDGELELVKGANLAGIDLRNATAINAFFVKAKLARAHMEYGQFIGADLRRADLQEAHLNGANLTGASLQDVQLTFADLRNAFLYGAQLRGANISRCDLQQADLGSSELMGAILDWANLSFTAMEWADLQEARMSGANFTGTKLNGANLKYSDFRDVPYRSDGITRGLNPEMIIVGQNWQLAFFNPDMLKLLGLPPDHNEKLKKQMEAEQSDMKHRITSRPISPK
jgi:uncharacterized protein YjbI with pentapeptide repeats